MENNRLDVRQRCRFMVRFGYTSSFTADVCGGGFCVQLMKVLPVGAAVEGSIRVAGKEMPFAGGVAWVKPGDRYQNLLGRMGVYFTRIPADFPIRARLSERGTCGSDAGATKRDPTLLTAANSVNAEHVDHELAE